MGLGRLTDGLGVAFLLAGLGLDVTFGRAAVEVTVVVVGLVVVVGDCVVVEVVDVVVEVVVGRVVGAAGFFVTDRFVVAAGFLGRAVVRTCCFLVVGFTVVVLVVVGASVVVLVVVVAFVVVVLVVVEVVVVLLGAEVVLGLAVTGLGGGFLAAAGGDFLFLLGCGFLVVGLGTGLRVTGAVRGGAKVLVVVEGARVVVGGASVVVEVAGVVLDGNAVVTLVVEDSLAIWHGDLTVTWTLVGLLFLFLILPELSARLLIGSSEPITENYI